MKNDKLKVMIMGILYPPEGMVYPTMPSKEDMLIDLFQNWALMMVGDDANPNGDAKFHWQGQDWTTPKIEGYNGAKAEIRKRIEEYQNPEEELPF